MAKRALGYLLLATIFPFSGIEGAANATVTRVEEGDRTLVYSGNWYSNENEAHSGGTATLTNARGARATVRFTGTGISWIGVADRWAGLATVYVDGAMTTSTPTVTPRAIRTRDMASMGSRLDRTH